MLIRNKICSKIKNRAWYGASECWVVEIVKPVVKVSLFERTEVYSTEKKIV